MAALAELRSTRWQASGLKYPENVKSVEKFPPAIQAQIRFFPVGPYHPEESDYSAEFRARFAVAEEFAPEDRDVLIKAWRTLKSNRVVRMTLAHSDPSHLLFDREIPNELWDVKKANELAAYFEKLNLGAALFDPDRLGDAAVLGLGLVSYTDKKTSKKQRLELKSNIEVINGYKAVLMSAKSLCSERVLVVNPITPQAKHLFPNLKIPTDDSIGSFFHVHHGNRGPKDKREYTVRVAFFNSIYSLVRQGIKEHKGNVKETVQLASLEADLTRVNRLLDSIRKDTPKDFRDSVFQYFHEVERRTISLLKDAKDANKQEALEVMLLIGEEIKVIEKEIEDGEHPALHKLTPLLSRLVRIINRVKSRNSHTRETSAFNTRDSLILLGHIAKGESYFDTLFQALITKDSARIDRHVHEGVPKEDIFTMRPYRAFGIKLTQCFEAFKATTEINQRRKILNQIFVIVKFEAIQRGISELLKRLADNENIAPGELKDALSLTNSIRLTQQPFGDTRVTNVEKGQHRYDSTSESAKELVKNFDKLRGDLSNNQSEDLVQMRADLKERLLTKFDLEKVVRELNA